MTILLHSLPGRSLATGQPIWLCNAHSADSKVFSRSLLAKSASIQTVICFPHFRGVIELGVTELVPEDPSLIQHIKVSLLEFSKPICSEKSSSAPYSGDDDMDCMYTKFDHEIEDTTVLDNFHSPRKDTRSEEEKINKFNGNIEDDLTVSSPDDCSNGCEHHHQTQDSFLHEGINGGSSQVQSQHFRDDDFSNCDQDSMNSSNCISQPFMNQENIFSPTKGDYMDKIHLKEPQECNYMKSSSLDLATHSDLYYARTLTNILRNSHWFLENLRFGSNDYKSSFVSWKKGEIAKSHWPEVQQKMLKKILFLIPLLHGSCSFKSQKVNYTKGWLLKPMSGEICMRRPFSYERTENEKFLALRSMIPPISKIDKVSVLDNTIEYLRQLEARLEELESFNDFGERKTEATRKHSDLVEQTCENTEDRRIGNGNNWFNKRKACDIDETDPGLSSVVPKAGPLLDMKVKIKEQDVVIELRCQWRDYLLLDIIDTLNNLNLDVFSVQSSTTDDVLNVTLQAKFRGAAVASARMIKQALSTIGGKC
ncbi:transcription factor GLABRA 3 isoform X2 [Diospyros lotus]|uniref:transcription factor GLABRA 3 isoform X2 n=1 Tax=Diospyros lotus TaxID=55363 RepID=UPI002254647B|nr:transcription factor GLABRA 3 isoform X2 [Diospyros lotus]